MRLSDVKPLDWKQEGKHRIARVFAGFYTIAMHGDNLEILSCSFDPTFRRLGHVETAVDHLAMEAQFHWSNLIFSQLKY